MVDTHIVFASAASPRTIMGFVVTVEGLGQQRRGLGSGLRITPLITRRVFFSFHYQRDITRVQQVKNHWVAKGSHASAGFFDGSLEEKAKTQGDLAVKRLINTGMQNSSITCVLIGSETFSRRWVSYEIFRSVALGRGLFGVRINNMKDINGRTDLPGINPFEILGYGGKSGSQKLWPMIRNLNGWSDFPLAEDITHGAAKYLIPGEHPILSGLFRVYDWVNDDGYNNFTSWVDAAADHAGR